MKIIIVIIVVAVLAVGGYLFYRNSYNKPSQSSSNNSTASVSTNSVEIKNMSFNPQNITVKVGSEISFTNNDGINHTVTADGGKFDQPVSPGQTITITITDTGTYGYHCSIHTSMTGTIIVQ